MIKWVLLGIFLFMMCWYFLSVYFQPSGEHESPLQEQEIEPPVIIP